MLCGVMAFTEMIHAVAGAGVSIELRDDGIFETYKYRIATCVEVGGSYEATLINRLAS